jgi:hypothetical protein
MQKILEESRRFFKRRDVHLPAFATIGKENPALTKGRCGLNTLTPPESYSTVITLKFKSTVIRPGCIRS